MTSCMTSVEGPCAYMHDLWGWSLQPPHILWKVLSSSCLLWKLAYKNVSSVVTASPTGASRNPPSSFWGHVASAWNICSSLSGAGFHQHTFIFLCRPRASPAPGRSSAEHTESSRRTLPARGKHRWAVMRFISLRGEGSGDARRKTRNIRSLWSARASRCMMDSSRN